MNEEEKNGPRTARVLYIPAKGDWEFRDEPLDEDGGIPLDTLQKAVGGLIDHTDVCRPSGDTAGMRRLDMWVNDEGKLLCQPLNCAATRISYAARFYGDFIVGDVIVCAHDGDGRSVGLSESEENILRSELPDHE